MDPLAPVLIVAAVASGFTAVASLVTHDSSWVDRLWSILPVIYVWIFAGSAIVTGQDASRLIVMAVLVTAWGARLTFNFARKGGYSGVEDYRWEVVRGRMTPGQYRLFTILFIVLAQNALLVAITLPASVAWQHPSPLTAADIPVAAMFVVFLGGETVADQQQWRFHEAKKRGDADRGFLTTGLFRYSRHPNFFCEQGQWWMIYVFGAVAAGSILNASIVGALALTALFVGSTVLTESISASKYPAYAEYKRTTSMLVPLPPRRQTPSLSPDSRR